MLVGISSYWDLQRWWKPSICIRQQCSCGLESPMNVLQEDIFREVFLQTLSYWEYTLHSAHKKLSPPAYNLKSSQKLPWEMFELLSPDQLSFELQNYDAAVHLVVF